MEEALYTILSRAAVSAIVGSRIYPNERPQSTDLECVTYQRTSGVRDYVMGGRTGVVESRFLINCWAKSRASKSGYARAKLLARAVRDTISPAGGFRETVSGIDIHGIFVRNERDERADGASGVGRFSRVMFDVTIWHTE
jgi:hypothetical protein